MNKVNTAQLLDLLRQKQWQGPLCWVRGATDKPIFLQKMLRDLTARRATFLAEYQGQKSIVKLFYDKQGLRHVRREMRGLQLLKQCEVATSHVLEYEVLADSVLLVLSYLENTYTLTSQWGQWNEPKKKDCLSSILQQLAKMHKKGVCHNDLHLDNILIDEKKIYIIDGMDVQCTKKAGFLSYRTQLNNLADFFVQFSTLDQELLWAVLTENAPKWFMFNKAWIPLLQKRIIHKSLYRQRKMQSKAWRECSAFTLGKLGAYQYVVAAEKKDSVITMFNHLMQKKEDYFKTLKHGRTNSVFHYQWGELDWIVKQYSAFKSTHAAVSWQNANRLQSLQILTAKPIAILRKKWKGLKNHDYFVMEYVPGQMLFDYLHSFCDLQEQQQMIVKVVQVMNSLKQNRLCLRDVKALNWRVCGGKLYLLDLNNLRVYSSWKIWFINAFNKDVKRFLKIWVDRPVLQQAFTTAFKESGLL